MTTFPHFLNPKRRECGEENSRLSWKGLRGPVVPLCPALRCLKENPQGRLHPHLVSPAGRGVRSGVRMGAGGLQRVGEGAGSKAPASLPDPPQLAVVPVTCRSPRLPGLPPGPHLSGEPPGSPCPKSLPRAVDPPASGVIPVRAPGHPQTWLVSLRARALPFPPVPELHAARVSLRPLAAPPPPAAGCGSPWPGSRRGKFPGPGPAGRGKASAVAASAGRRREPAARAPRGVLRRERERRVSRLPALSGGGGGCSRPLRASGRPACGRPPWGIRPGAAVSAVAPSPRRPSTRQELHVWLPVCRARWRCRERRGQCLHLLTKGSRSSAPAERPAALLHTACLPATSPRRAALQRPGPPAPLAAGCGGSERAPAEGLRAAGGGRRCGRGCSRGLCACRAPSLQLWSCRTREQQVAESSAPSRGAPGPGGRRAGPAVRLPGRLSA